MYMPTSSTSTESVMFTAISASSKKAGSGAIIAITIQSTAIGTANSGQGSERKPWMIPASAPVDGELIGGSGEVEVAILSGLTRSVRIALASCCPFRAKVFVYE